MGIGAQEETDRKMKLVPELPRMIGRTKLLRYYGNLSFVVADTRTPDQRRRIMQSVKTENTGPEWKVRRLLHRLRQLDAIMIWPALAVVVFGELTHLPLLQSLDIKLWDKALHFTAYFGLAVMATVAVRADRRALWWSLGLVAMGGALEIVQGMTGRDCDIYDEFANALGVAAGFAVGWAGVALLKALKILGDD